MAVIEHIGATPRSGHYVAYVLGPDGCYWEANDTRVERTTKSRVLESPWWYALYQLNDIEPRPPDIVVQPGLDPRASCRQQMPVFHLSSAGRHVAPRTSANVVEGPQTCPIVILRTRSLLAVARTDVPACGVFRYARVPDTW